MLIKRRLPVVVAFASGMAIVAQYFLKIDGWAGVAGDVVKWNVIVGAFALAVGMGNLISIHGRKVARRDKDGAFSAVLLISMIGWFVLGVSRGTNAPLYRLLWDSLLLPAQATMYSTTIFFITSSAYRAFRVKNLQSGILLASAILVMGRVGIGAVLWPGFQSVSGWLMQVPNTAGMRAITIGGSMALVGSSMRIILGLERSYLGGE